MPLPKITTRFPVAELHGRCVALEALLSALLANQLASLDIEKAQQAMADIRTRARASVNECAGSGVVDPLIVQVKQFADQYIDAMANEAAHTATPPAPQASSAPPVKVPGQAPEKKD